MCCTCVSVLKYPCAREKLKDIPGKGLPGSRKMPNMTSWVPENTKKVFFLHMCTCILHMCTCKRTCMYMCRTCAHVSYIPAHGYFSTSRARRGLRRREGKHNSQFSAAHIITRQSMLPRCPSQLPEIRSYDAVSELGGYQFQDARQFYTRVGRRTSPLTSGRPSVRSRPRPSVRASNFCVFFGTWR